MDAKHFPAGELIVDQKRLVRRTSALQRGQNTVPAIGLKRAGHPDRGAVWNMANGGAFEIKPLISI